MVAGRGIFSLPAMGALRCLMDSAPGMSCLSLLLLLQIMTPMRRRSDGTRKRGRQEAVVFPNDEKAVEEHVVDYGTVRRQQRPPAFIEGAPSCRQASVAVPRFRVHARSSAGERRK